MTVLIQVPRQCFSFHVNHNCVQFLPLTHSVYFKESFSSTHPPIWVRTVEKRQISIISFSPKILARITFLIFFLHSNALVSGKKNSDFSANISPKNLFSACMEKIFAKENRKSKNRRKIEKCRFFHRKNPACGARACEACLSEKIGDKSPKKLKKSPKNH